jgi:hypothetical protein
LVSYFQKFDSNFLTDLHQFVEDRANTKNTSERILSVKFTTGLRAGGVKKTFGYRLVIGQDGQKVFEYFLLDRYDSELRRSFMCAQEEAQRRSRNKSRPSTSEKEPGLGLNIHSKGW